MSLTTLNTTELRVGMIVQHHGMRLLIDQPNCALGTHADERVQRFNALFLNRDEVTNEEVPYGWTTCEFYPSRGLPAEPKGTHRWPIQGNDLATWRVETDTIPTH